MPFNSQAPANICNGCPYCCVVLGTWKKHPHPKEIVKPGFHAFVDSESCEARHTCRDRYPMEAITIELNETMIFSLT
jgi:hypothetical protein